LRIFIRTRVPRSAFLMNTPSGNRKQNHLVHSYVYFGRLNHCCHDPVGTDPLEISHSYKTADCPTPHSPGRPQFCPSAKHLLSSGGRSQPSSHLQEAILQRFPPATVTVMHKTCHLYTSTLLLECCSKKCNVCSPENLLCYVS